MVVDYLIRSTYIPLSLFLNVEYYPFDTFFFRVDFNLLLILFSFLIYLYSEVSLDVVDGIVSSIGRFNLDGFVAV